MADLDALVGFVDVDDEELRELVAATMEAIDSDDVSQLLQVFREQAELDPSLAGSVHIRQRRLTALKSLLRGVIDFSSEAHRADLTADQTRRVLAQLLDTEGGVAGLQATVRVATEALNNAADRNNRLSEPDISLLEQLATQARRVDAVGRAMRAYSTTQQLGLTTADGVSVISSLLGGATPGGPTGIEPLVKVLNALTVGDAPRALVAEVLAAISEEAWGDQVRAHESLLDLTARLPRLRMTLEELLTEIRYDQGLGIGIGTASEQLRRARPRSGAFNHFPGKPGRLELKLLPYQTQQTLNEGLGDLAEIAAARSSNLQEIGKACFVLDTRTSTWYSLGGKTVSLGDALQYIFVEYDLSRLAPKPVLFHCCSDDLKPPPPRSTDPRVQAFARAAPTEDDCENLAKLLKATNDPITPVSFFIGQNSAVRFTFPNDADALNDLSGQMVPLAYRVAGKIDDDPSMTTAQAIAELSERIGGEFSLSMHRLDEIPSLLHQTPPSARYSGPAPRPSR